MRSDCASIPTRGSRLVGLLSMIMTSVLGSGACEQERRDSSHTPIPANKSRSLKQIVILSGAKRLLLASFAAGSRIRDLPQYRWTFGSGCRWHIARSPMPRLISEEGEGHCLFGFGRKSELIGKTECDSQRFECLAQHGD